MTTPQHRPATDRPPAGPLAIQGHDTVSPSGRSQTGEAVDQRRGDDAEDRSPSAAAPGRMWRPRSVTPEDLDDARTILVVHRLDPQVGRCAACAADCPCPPALDAGRVLAEAGAWNTVPFTGPARSWTRRGRPEPGDGWVSRLVRHLPWTAAK